MKWISIKDRLPDKGQKGLCIQDPKKTATRDPLWFIFDGESFLPPSFISVFANYEIGKTHWADIIYWVPLPPPPEKE